MRSEWKIAVISVACLAVYACGSGSKTATAPSQPTGQVVATVNGEEITLRELNAELGSRPVPSDPKAAKAAEQAALNSIITRKILAGAAREQGLDKTPDFALQQLRTMDSLLAQTLQAKIVQDLPAPTQEEAERYIADHRDLFAERKIFDVDQITLLRPTDPAKLKVFEPLKTMADVENVLKREQVDYRHITNGVIDTVGSNPELIDRIVKLAPNEVFVFANGNALLVNQIRQVRVVPFTGEPAVNYAIALIRNQRLQETTQKQFNAIMAKAQSSIQYNKAYAPPPPAPAEPPAAKPDAAPETGEQPSSQTPDAKKSG